MNCHLLTIFSFILLFSFVSTHITNYETDLNTVLDQLSKFESSIKNVKNSTLDSSTLLSTDKSSNDDNGGSLNIILPVTIGGVVVATVCTSLIVFFVLRKKRNTQLYAGAPYASSASSLNNLAHSKKPSYEDLVSIGYEF